MSKTKPLTVDFIVDTNTRERFYNKIKEDLITKCWNWQGYKNKKGYGQLKVGKFARLAHRVSYIIHKGIIPFSYQIDHLCRNTSCVNPDHLEAVLPIVNFYRSKEYYNHFNNEDHPSYGKWKEWEDEKEKVPF